MPARVALAATSAVVVLVAVALVGGTAQYATAVGAVANLASATVTSSSSNSGDVTVTSSAKEDDDDDEGSADDEYSELRKQCLKQAQADKKAAEEDAKAPTSPPFPDGDGKKVTKEEKDAIKAQYEADKAACEAQFPKD